MNYFWLTIKHKWYVFLAGLGTKTPLWRLIKHDWTKFTPAEYPYYQRQFFGDKGDPEGFSRAWLHHQNFNDHHWEYWIPRTGHTKCESIVPNNALDMPEVAVREMIADWQGASRAYNGTWPNIKEWKWYNENYPNIRKQITDKTHERIQMVLNELRNKL